MLLLYVLFLLLFAPQRDATTNKKKILCLGDSLTREGSWIHFVEEHFGTSNLMFINGGKNGRKSGQIFYPLVHTYTQQHKLDGIVLFIGVNDFNNLKSNSISFNRTVADVLKNMSKVVEASLQLFPKNNIFLLAPCNINPANMSSFALNHGYGTSGCAAGLSSLNKLYEKLAEQYSIHFLSLYAIVDRVNYVDGVHLSRAGYKQVAAAISGKIESDGIFC